MCSTCFFSTNLTPLPYLYHQIRQNFRISFSLWLCMQWVTNCQAALGCGYSASLKPGSVRLEDWLLSSLHRLVGCSCPESTFPLFRLPGPLLAFRPDFEASVVNSYYVQRELTTVGSTPEKICFCLFVSKLCNCNPLKKSAELLSAFLHHLTSGR